MRNKLRASSQIFDVKELQLKFNEYKQKDDILNMIKRRMSINCKKITALVKGSKLFDDLSDEQFQVLNLIKGFFVDKNFVQNTLNMWAGGQRVCPISKNGLKVNIT